MAIEVVMAGHAVGISAALQVAMAPEAVEGVTWVVADWAAAATATAVAATAAEMEVIMEAWAVVQMVVGTQVDGWAAVAAVRAVRDWVVAVAVGAALPGEVTARPAGWAAGAGGGQEGVAGVAHTMGGRLGMWRSGAPPLSPPRCNHLCWRRRRIR